ncbi:Kinase suppressor of Ras 2, partial [Galemys pyrenaicus]
LCKPRGSNHHVHFKDPGKTTQTTRGEHIPKDTVSKSHGVSAGYDSAEALQRWSWEVYLGKCLSGARCRNEASLQQLWLVDEQSGHWTQSMCPLLSTSQCSKLVKYFSRQLSCKKKVALQERNAELEGFPQLRHWFRIVDVRKEVLEVTAPCPHPCAPLLPGPPPVPPAGRTAVAVVVHVNECACGHHMPSASKYQLIIIAAADENFASNRLSSGKRRPDPAGLYPPRGVDQILMVLRSVGSRYPPRPGGSLPQTGGAVPQKQHVGAGLRPKGFTHRVQTLAVAWMGSPSARIVGSRKGRLREVSGRHWQEAPVRWTPSQMDPQSDGLPARWTPSQMDSQSDGSPARWTPSQMDPQSDGLPASLKRNSSSVSGEERSRVPDSYEEITPGQLSLEDLLEMTDEQVCETVEKYGANREECARLNASLTCLRNVHMSGERRMFLPMPALAASGGGETAEERGAWDLEARRGQGCFGELLSRDN